jgi:tetratricopeptide (TPR) repeat protein
MANGIYSIYQGGLLMSDQDDAKQNGLPPVAYPRFIVENDKPTTEPTLSPTFFERNLSHLIGRRTGEGVWPDDSDNPEAVALFQQGQKALYETKDVALAIRSYEAALDKDSGYVKAWVALAIAYISDNTSDSLDRAQEVLDYLCALEPSDWLTEEASGIIYQNRAYLNVHRFRQTGEKAYLSQADADYAVCDARSGDRPRIEYLCPWAYVKLETGDALAARALWDRARTFAEGRHATHLLAEYAAKYAPLRSFLHMTGRTASQILN